MWEEVEDRSVTKVVNRDNAAVDAAFHCDPDEAFAVLELDALLVGILHVHLCITARQEAAGVSG